MSFRLCYEKKKPYLTLRYEAKPQSLLTIGFKFIIGNLIIDLMGFI